MSGDAPCFTSHFKQRRIEFLLDANMQCGATALVLHVDVRAFQRERFRRLEPLPAPAREERRHADDDFLVGAGVDQQLENVHVVPPAGGIEAGRLRASLDQQFDDGGVAAERGREPDRLAEIGAGPALFFDVEPRIEQERHQLRAGAFRLAKLLGVGAAREVQQVPALIVPDLRAAPASPRGCASSP